MQLHICSGRMDFGSNLSGLAHFSSIQCQYCNMLWCKLVNLGVNKKNTRIGYCSIESSTNSGSGHWTALFIVPDHRKKNATKKHGTAFLPGYNNPFSYHSGVWSENDYALYIISFFGILQWLYVSAKIKAEIIIEFRIQTYFHQNHGVTWVRELELKSSPPYGSQRHIYQRENLCLHPSSCSFQYRSPHLLASHMKHRWSYSTSQDQPKDGIHPTLIFSERISVTVS